MFKSARWRSDRNKIKAVFKLQFHLTQVVHVGGDPLVISLIPSDIGKPTVRLEKSVVRDGSCYWENPLYETVKFSQDPKTGRILEKIYKFVISSDGSTKSGLVGEVSIDLASYSESFKLSSVSLPLKNACDGVALHVSIQRMKESTDLSEHEEIEVVKNVLKDRSLRAQLSFGDTDESTESVKDGPFRDENADMVLNGNNQESSGSDLTISSSASSSDIDTPRESILNPEEDSRIVIEKLQTELADSSRQAEMSGLELQTLRKQIVKETKKGQDLAREVIILKEECERLKKAQRHTDGAKFKNQFQFEGGDTCALVEELRQELNYEKNLNANLRLQLQKTQESNSELILAVNDLDELLEQKKSEISGKEQFQAGKEENAESEKKVEELLSELEITRREKDELEAHAEQLALDYEILKQENHDLSYKLEQTDLQEHLKMQYECSSSFDTIYELETHIENLEGKIGKQSLELSESVSAVAQLQTHVKNLEVELEEQSRGFEADLEIITSEKVEQEQRAIKAEESLRKIRLQSGNAAKKLQDDFQWLSVQMESTFKANEKVASKAMSEASELRLLKLHLEETLRKAKEELQLVKDQYESKLHDLSSEINLKVLEIEGLQSEMRDMSKQMKNQLKETEIMLQRGNNERTEMENVISLLRKKAKKTMEELNSLRILEDEKEGVIGNLKESLAKEELEKDHLRDQVSRLSGDLKKKGEALFGLEKKLKDATRTSSRNNKSSSHHESKETSALKEKIKLLEGQIKQKEAALETSTITYSQKEKDLESKVEELEKRFEELKRNQNEVDISGERRKLGELLNEIALLKAKNGSMEAELKEMQERYSEMSLKFAEVEGERQELIMRVRNLQIAKKG